MTKFLVTVTFLFSAFVFACPMHAKSNTAAYPDEWWKPVPESDLASWEIGPQGADRTKNEVILSKRNDL